MRAQVIARRGSGPSGTSRYTGDLVRGLQAAGVDARVVHPAGVPLPAPLARSLKRLGADLGTFFDSYPLRAPLGAADVYHLSSQTLATLLLFRRFPAPVVVTVLDIIPWLVRRDPSLSTFRHPLDAWFYRLSLRGLRRADALIAISEWTKRTLVQELDLPQERIHVVYPAVDHDRFRPQAVTDQFRARYGLDTGHRYVLYVGSDDPRKNLPTLVRAFARVANELRDACLLIVGASRFPQQRRHLLGLVETLGLAERTILLDEVPDEDLPQFYNVADLFVLPSLYEGFGLPALEAVTCGTPVLVSDAASLPEVAGTGPHLASPGDASEWSQKIRTHLSQGRGVPKVRAMPEDVLRFSPERQAAGVRTVYAALIGRAAAG